MKLYEYSALALICLVNLTFNLLTLKLVHIIARGVGNLPTNFGDLLNVPCIKITVAHHRGFLDDRRSCGQLSCVRTFATSLSVTAFFWRAGGSMLARTGKEGSGLKRKVPEMSH